MNLVTQFRVGASQASSLYLQIILSDFFKFCVINDQNLKKVQPIKEQLLEVGERGSDPQVKMAGY